MIDEDGVLKRFMLEHFDFDGLKKSGFFKGLKRNDYKKQAEILCKYFGYKTIYEYGTTEMRVHISYAGDRPKHVDENGELKEAPFVEVFKSWLDD
jgi:hypothetical protein